MNCDHATRVLDAGLDHELDEATNAELAEHVAGCPACARLQGDREALRDALRRAPRHAAPARLRRAIGTALAGLERPSPVRPPRGLSWPKASALVAVAAVVAFAAGWWVAVPGSVRDERDELVARHVDSLASGGRLFGVASSDRHVVKPWFAGKIDFAPPVRDLSGSGFALLGARLDRVAARPSAVLVYRIREHDINLFVSRSSMQRPEVPTVSMARGFAVATWADDGLAFTAISDVDPKELGRFSALMRSPIP